MYGVDIMRITRGTVMRFDKGHSNKKTFLLMTLLSWIFILPSFSVAAELKAGDMAPLFTAIDMAEETRSLQEAVDKGIVLLDFWSIYCVACLEEMPKIIELHDKYKDKGLTVLSINLDSFGTRRVKRFIDGMAYKIPFPVIIDRKREIAGSYKVTMLPTTIIIGKDKNIAYHHIGYTPGDEEKFEEIIKNSLL
jgi:peroxiredoxin